jgi:hypothetical protein
VGGFSPGFRTTGRPVTTGVWMIFVGAGPPDALVETTASTFQLNRQLVGRVVRDKRPPNPNPFCGAMLPTATCKGWSVNNSVASDYGFR